MSPKLHYYVNTAHGRMESLSEFRPRAVPCHHVVYSEGVLTVLLFLHGITSTPLPEPLVQYCTSDARRGLGSPCGGVPTGHKFSMFEIFDHRP
jgi:hypothetical protein